MMRLARLLCLTLMLSGCGKDSPCSKKSQSDTKDPLDFLCHLKNRLPVHFSMDQLKEYIHEGDLKSASRYVNLAIKTSTGNPALHVINGFIYEEMLRAGDPTCAQLAGVAYRTAHDLDPSHWLYAYLLGSYELREKNYESAQQHLANALLLRPDHSDTLYALACASYYLSDIPVALNSIQKALVLSPNSPSIQRSGAIIFAAAGKFDKANKALDCYSELSGKKCAADVAQVRSRIEDWKVTHQQARCHTVAAQTIDYGDQKDQEDSKILSKTPTVILDCYLLAMIETATTVKGNDFLNLGIDTNGVISPLSVVLGGTTPKSVGSTLFGTKRILTRNRGATPPPPALNNTWQGSWTKTFNYAIGPSALKYSLNIANAGDRILEFNARPSVSTLLGEPATFLNSDIIVGTPPGAAQVSVDAGVKLECKPIKIANDGCITLEITLTSSQLNDNYTPDSTRGIDSQLIAVVKAKASTTVKVYPGQTVMVAGIKSDTRVTRDSGVPFLRSLPLAQYFFSKVETTSDNRNLLYLVTPRLGGGTGRTFNPCTKVSIGPSRVAQKLKRGGLDLGGLGEYSSLYYILKHFERSPLFADFRSGDLVLPFWGYEHTSLPHKLNQLSSFLYF